MHEYIAQPGASGGLAGALKPSEQNQPTTDSAIRLTHRNPDTPRAQMVVLAYGQPPKSLRNRAAAVVQLMKGHRRLTYLRLAMDGTPRHPLYLKDNLQPLDYREKTR